MILERGDTFMLEDDDGTGEHLHVILTSPTLAGEVVTVSISTRRAKSETLVCVQPGEHPFITRESICAYRFARIRTVEAIGSAIASGHARQKEKASEDLIRRLAAGLVDSDFVSPGVVAFYKGVREGLGS